MDTIVMNIRRILDERGMKQRALAEKSGIPEKTLSAMMNGRREVHHSEMLSLCNALFVTPNELYGIGAPAGKTKIIA